MQAHVGEIAVVCPFDGELLGHAPAANGTHVEEYLTTAYSLAKNRKAWLPLDRRVEILGRLAELMAEQKGALTLLAASEGGKPYKDSAVEVDRAIDGVHLCIEHIRSHAGEVIPMGGTAGSRGKFAVTRRDPIGVVVAVSAFNHPLNLIVHQVLAAVAAGCPVIVKPADVTPLSCLKLAELLHDAGLPNGWCQVCVAESNDVSQKLVTDHRVAFFSFIGSSRVGWFLRSQLSPGTRCALEHGGVAPVLLCEDADVDHAVSRITPGGFYHAGQVCVSVQRVYTQTEKAGAFAESLAAAASKLVVGDPRVGTTDVGPLILEREVARVHSWVEEAKAAGATVLCGGQPVNDTCYQPTVILNPPDDAKVSCQEVFGPVVCVYGSDSMQGAIDRANALPFAFQAAVFTQRLDVAMRAWRDLDASAVMVNEHTAFRIDGMPFAGLRQSGLGVGGVGHTIDDMQISKMLVISDPELA